MPINRVKEAISAIKNGQIVIMMDDEDRENEGDLVYAATFSTPQKVNFLASHAKGLICVALESNISKRLELNPMVENNNSQHETAFTVSVDDIDCTTGISAYERDLTIRRLADPLSTKEHLVRPGHIFPLVAKDGGVLERTGHTEGSVDLCKLAGISPVAVICEIMKDDGEMARRSELLEYGKKHDMKIVYISDIVEYRLRNETLVDIISREKVEFFGKISEKITIKDHRDFIHTVYVYGDISDNPLVKYHTVGDDLALLQNEKKLTQLLDSIEKIKKDGGMVIFMQDEFYTNTLIKDFGIGAQILRCLGVQKFKLLTSKSNREYVGIHGFGIQISEEIVLN